MTGTPALIIFVIFVAGLVAFVVWLVRKRKAEVATLMPQLASRGWSHAERDDSVFAGLSALPFGRGNGAMARDVLRASDPEFVAYTYRWRTGSGEHKNDHTRRITMLKQGPEVPLFEVEPQTVVARVETAAAGGDLDVELADFNRAWSVRATDPRVTHAMLHPRMVERFMHPDMFGRGVFFEGGWIAMVDQGVQTPMLAEHAEQSLAILRELAALIPPHLVKEFS